MNAFSIIKLLTLVSFLVVGQVSLAQDAKKADSSAASTSSKKNIAPEDVDSNTICSEYDNAKKCRDKKEQLEEESSAARDARLECRANKTKYDELSAKSSMACGAFEKTKSPKGNKNSCAENIASCRQKIEAMEDTKIGSTVSTDGKSSTDLMFQIAMTGIQSKLGTAASGDQSGAVSCVKEPDAKERKEAKKDKNKEIKELEKEIKKESDEQAKLLEKQREKLDEIKKKTNEIEADYKKELLKKDTKEREQTAEINKSSVDTAKKLRQYGTAITKEQQSLAKERLNYQKSMLDLTSEKVTARCKQEFEALKQGIINIKIGDPSNSSSEKQQLEALAKQYKGKATGTAQLTELLNMAKKTCFEKANSQIADVNLASNQNIQTINGRIEELQQSINDEKKTAENNLTAIEAVKKGMTDEKAAEEKEKLDKLSALNEEVINFQTSTEEKLNISRAQAAKLQDDIRKLKLRVDFDVVTAFDEADSAILSAERARKLAVANCGCETDTSSGAGKSTTTADKACSLLMVDPVKQEGPATRKTKEKVAK